MILSAVAGLMSLMAASPQSFVLNLDTNVHDVTAKDISGDGIAELLVLCCDEKSRPLVKYLAVFEPGPDGAYPGTPTARLDLDPSISTIFFAQTDQTPAVELVAADGEGAVIYSYSGGKFVTMASPRFSSLLPTGAKDPTFYTDIAKDLDGDKIDEWIIPVPGGFEIRSPQNSITRIACDIVSEMTLSNSAYIYHRLPACHAFDLDGEPKKCLAFLSDEVADFAHGLDWGTRQRFEIPLNVDDKWEASSRMTDINGDGFPDLVVTQTRGTINMKAITQVYLATAPFTYPQKPDAVFEAAGGLAAPAFVDVDGDDKKDMILIQVPLGVRNIINFFTRHKVSVRLEVYLLKDGRFGNKPNFTESFTLDAPDGLERVAYTLGDFNGDDRIDLAFAAGRDRLVIHTGSADAFISSRPWVGFDIPAFGVARAYDLNNNVAKDLVIHHPGGDNKKRIDVIVF
ncbi:MAG: FG-GAP-like repeat-containing protein [Candidatus Hydrogenedentes bacterium]|nr:FG-GAP-like repeat-containing protein [Candidatus Hydrogenedentota bacterium]